MIESKDSIESAKCNARSRHGEQSHDAHEQLANAQCINCLEFDQH